MLLAVFVMTRANHISFSRRSTKMFLIIRGNVVGAVAIVIAMTMSDVVDAWSLMIHSAIVNILRYSWHLLVLLEA